MIDKDKNDTELEAETETEADVVWSSTKNNHGHAWILEVEALIPQTNKTDTIVTTKSEYDDEPTEDHIKLHKWDITEMLRDAGVVPEDYEVDFDE